MMISRPSLQPLKTINVHFPTFLLNCFSVSELFLLFQILLNVAIQIAGIR